MTNVLLNFVAVHFIPNAAVKGLVIHISAYWLSLK